MSPPAKSTSDPHGLFAVNGDKVSVFVYIVLTVAVFAVLGLVQKLVERL